MEIITLALLLVAKIYNSAEGKVWMPDHLEKDGSMQDHLALAVKLDLVTLDGEFIFNNKGNDVMLTMSLPFMYLKTKVIDAIDYHVGGRIADADKDELKGLDSLKHSVNHAVHFNRDNYGGSPK